LSIYLSAKMPEKPPVIHTPETPATGLPPTYFGPSASAVIRTARGREYRSHLWIGGKGLSEDGRWGKMFSFSFETGMNGDAPPGFIATVLMNPYRDQLVALYGAEATDILMAAIPRIVAGKFYDRPLLAEEIRETFV
jgi:hypothetical protein